MSLTVTAGYQLGMSYACLFFLFITLLLYLSQKRMHTYASFLFSLLFITIILFVLADTATYLIEVRILPFNPILCELTLFLYCLFTVLILYLITIFGYMSALSKRKTPMTSIAFSTAVPAIGSIILFLCFVGMRKFTFYEGELFGINTAGFIILLADYFIYALANLILIFLNKGKFTIPVVIVIQGCYIVYAGVCKGIMPLSLFATIDILILYVIAQNPRSFLSEDQGCFNKKAFDTYLYDLELRKKSFYIITVDIVHFNYYVTKFGNKISAQILKHLLHSLPQSTKNTCVFNYDSDIFAIVTTSKSQYDTIINYWTNNLTQNWDVDGNKINLSFFVTHYYKSNSRFSNDIATFVEKYIDFEKANPKSRIVCINNRMDLMLREQAITDAISSAIANNGFDIYFQPILNVKTKKFDKAEVLARLKDEVLGFIPPAEFIEIAEKRGLISDVTKQIITKTIQAMHEYDFVKLGISNVNVNLSSLEIGDTAILEFIDQMLATHNLKPENLTIELTETAEGGSYEMLATAASYFKERGYKLALDDFGTGYSSLDRILAIPFDFIKIDKTMLDLLTPQKKILLYSTIGMLKKCGYKVVVEGIETQEMAELMEEHEVDYIQGYYFSKPQDTLDTIKFLLSKQ